MQDAACVTYRFDLIYQACQLFQVFCCKCFQMLPQFSLTSLQLPQSTPPFRLVQPSEQQCMTSPWSPVPWSRLTRITVCEKCPVTALSRCSDTGRVFAFTPLAAPECYSRSRGVAVPGQGTLYCLARANRSIEVRTFRLH